MFFIIVFEMTIEVANHQLRYTKGWRRYSFFMFSKQFLSYHKERIKCWPGWYFICLVIYLTTIDDNFISIPFIILRYFQFHEVSQGWSFVRISVPTDQVPCKTIGISKLHCALHTHMLTNAKSVLPGKSIQFSKGNLVRNSNMLLIFS